MNNSIINMVSSMELNKPAYAVNQYTPGILYFGSDGGDIAYAFDTRNENVTIVEIPFESIHIEDAQLCAYGFNDFIEKMYNE